MSQGQEKEAVIMLTTTTEPYVFHIPAILSCPNGIVYRFRYQENWLHEQVVNSGSEYLRKCTGLLYLRDNESESKLCYPVRCFRILWKENAGIITFFGLEMGDIIQYKCIDTVEENVHAGSMKTSLRNISSEYSAQKTKGTTLPFQSRLAVPEDNEPPILTDEELHDCVDADKYVWLDKRGIFSWSGEISEAAEEENTKWSALMPAFSLIHQLRNVCFWRVLKLNRLGSPSETFSPKLIAESDESGLYTHGYEMTTDKPYTLSIRQVIPKAFADEDFQLNQFDINLENSDPYIEPLISREVIDGTYDMFDLSFRFHGEAARKVCLLRIKCTQPLNVQKSKENKGGANLSPSIPPTILPIRVRLPRRYQWFRGLAIFTAFLIPFVQSILRGILELTTPEGVQVTVPPSLELGVPIALLLLVFLFGWIGGIRLTSAG